MADDAKLGEKARALVRGVSDFAALLQVGAPTEMLAQQIDEMERTITDVLKECPEEWSDDPANWLSTIKEHQARLVELALYIQTRSPE